MAIATTIGTSSESAPNTENAPPPDDSSDPMLACSHNESNNSSNSGSSGNSSRQEQPSSSNESTMQAVMNQTTASEQIQSKNTFSLEFPVLLLFFSWNLSGTVFQNQVLYQTCMLTYNYSVCSRLTDEEIDEDLEAKLETYASKIFMARAVLESIIPAFISVLIGPWSDKFGRRPILLSTFCGYFLAYAILSIVAIVSTVILVNPWFYLVAFVPLSLLGGTCALITGVFCYISDISFERDRAFRMARMEAAVFMGLLFGALTCGPLYKWTSAWAVFGCSTICTFIALVWIFLFVKESIKNQTEQTSKMAKFRALFEWRHVVDLFYTCFKRRERHDRILIWLIIFTLASAMFVLQGSIAINYLFVRVKFQWMITDYNLYDAFNVVCQIVGNILGVYVLNQMLGIPVLILAMVGYFSAMTEYIVAGLANYSWQLYVASIVVMLKGIAVPMCRAYLASLVPSCEIGKIYSMTTSMESLAPIGAAPMYTLIYNYTLEKYPGAFNFFSAAVYLYCILLITMVYLIRKRGQATANYQQFTS